MAIKTGENVWDGKQPWDRECEEKKAFLKMQF